jgi:hypothetical protein
MSWSLHGDKFQLMCVFLAIIQMCRSYFQVDLSD